MQKRRAYNFHRGLGKDFIVALCFFVGQEILSIIYPMVLKTHATDMIKNDSGQLPELHDFLLNAGLVLGLLIIMFFVALYASNRVSVFGTKCRVNARADLYNKMNRVPTNILYEFGTGKFLSIMTYDTTLVKYRNEQYLKAGVYFVVTVLGSGLLIMLLSPLYILFILAAVVVEIFVVWVYNRVLSKRLPAEVAAYDKSFVDTRESIAGARDIRILGKLPERTAEAAKQNIELAKEPFDIDQSKHTFECINNMIYGVVTFGIILFGAVSLDNAHLAEQLVIISTIIQYLALVTKASNDIFTLLINPLTRGKIAYERIDAFLSLPEEDMDSGTTKIDTTYGTNLVLYRVSHRFWNGRKTITNLSMELTPGKLVAICGEAGGGKTTFVKMLLRHIEPTEGVILLNGVNIKDINRNYYRHDMIAYCPTYPEFVPGTVRQNIQLFNPDVTDEQILTTFNEIGATNLAILPSFLDTPLGVRSKMSRYLQSLVNVVRCLLKPAAFYIFDRSFLQLPNNMVQNILQKLRHENKTCLFTTYNSKICASCDEVFFAKNDHTYVNGTHAELFANNQDYAAFFMKAESMEVKSA